MPIFYHHDYFHEIDQFITALVENGYRHDKPFILQCERELNSSAAYVDCKITIWAEFMKSLEMDMLWWQLEEPEEFSGVWTESEKDEIENSRNISNLPNITGLTITLLLSPKI